MSRFALLATWLTLAALGADAPPTPVEPSELMKRPDLLGREVIVDDRVRLYQYHKGSDFDEIFLKRTLVIFRLPPSLRFERSPDASAARVRGILKKDGDLWVCNVTALELLPSDLDRLNRGVAALSPRDSEGRTAWARWAEPRGKAFEDQALRKRARELEGEAIRIEAERPSAQPAEHWLALAQRARTHEVPEPEPSALAHQAFRAQLLGAKTAEELKALRKSVVTFLPNAAKPSFAHVDLAKWNTLYATDPGAADRQAPEYVRAALDHRLWADITQALLERQAADDPTKAIDLADQASAQLPDRPEVAAKLLEEGLKVATREIGTLRQRDVEALAALYRDRMHQPERAQAVLRSWLDEQRNHRLSATDAEGRLALAQQYESLLNDWSTAIELLQGAWRIDPQSKDVADAFLRRGYRKVNDQWVAPSRPRTGDGESNGKAPLPAATGGLLLRLSPREARARLGGKPDRIVWSASQGQLIEQWIYREATQDQYVNLLHTPGDAVPRVVAHYTLPKTASSH
jgi:tetratricopeptide (TPR) repeat protein